MNEICQQTKAESQRALQYVDRSSKIGILTIQLSFFFFNFQEIVVGSNMDKIYIVMDYVEHDMKSLMETMKNPFLMGK